MAIIKKIREKSGLAIGLIGVGLASFLLGGDLLSSNSYILGKNKQIVGEIAGEEVSIQQFNQEVDAIKRRSPVPPNEEQMRSIRQYAWNEMIYKVAFKKEYDKLGLEVTDAEVEDMIKGNNIDPSFAAYFTDSTGEVSRTEIDNYLSRLKQEGTDSPFYQQHLLFEQDIITRRQRAKYNNLLTTTYFANKLEGKAEYEKQNTKAEVVYLNVPFYSVADSLVEVSDSDLKRYYDNHESEFERDANAGIEFVSFRVEPSEDDKYELEQEIKEMIAPFKTTVNDTAFVEANTDGNMNFINVGMNGVPTVMDATDLETGNVYGPYFVANAYRIYKVLEVGTDTTYAARASHILIKPASDAKADQDAARRKAQGILNKVRNNPKEFEALARTEGDATAATKSRGGDLNWFTEGKMVKPFEKAVFAARRTGVVPRLVKTDFGYHIINVTATKTNKLFRMAVVEKQLSASDATINEAYVKAGRFASMNKDRKAFEAAAEKDGLFIEQALTLRKDATYINSMRGSGVRGIIRWAFTEADAGDVSDVFELDDRFLVAVKLSEREEGVAPFDAVKSDVRREVLNEKKAEYISKKLAALSGSLEEIKNAYGKGATVNTQDDLSISATSLAGVGYAPKTIGTIFAMESGEQSSPIKDENSVTVVKVKTMDKALETADYSIYKNQIQQRNNRAATYKVMQAVSDLSDIEDERYKFF